MADAPKVTERQEQQNPKAAKDGKKSLGRRFLPWMIMAVVVAFCAGAGFGLGRTIGGSGPTKTAGANEQTEPALANLIKTDSSAMDSEETWYYDLEPVVANLNEPGVTRYVRVALTLQISAEVDYKKGTAYLEEKNPLLKNWLTIYLASQTIEDMRGDRNLRRIQSEILDALNEKLFPDAKPRIKRILFKGFAIQ